MNILKELRSINWSTRIKNKYFVSGVVALLVTAIYNFLALVDIAPAYTQDQTIQFLGWVISILFPALGIATDPTTPGLGDPNKSDTTPTGDTDEVN